LSDGISIFINNERKAYSKFLDSESKEGRKEYKRVALFEKKEKNKLGNTGEI
jgi:hypothetical protein